MNKIITLLIICLIWFWVISMVDISGMPTGLSEDMASCDEYHIEQYLINKTARKVTLVAEWNKGCVKYVNMSVRNFPTNPIPVRFSKIRYLEMMVEYEYGGIAIYQYTWDESVINHELVFEHPNGGIEGYELSYSRGTIKVNVLPVFNSMEIRK